MKTYHQIEPNKVTELFAAGMTQAEVAERLGVPKNRFSRRIHDNPELLRAREKGLSVAQKNKETDFAIALEDYAPHKAKEMVAYIALVERVLTSKWQTIGDMKRKLGERYRSDLMADALEMLQTETKGVSPAYWRKK